MDLEAVWRVFCLQSLFAKAGKAPAFAARRTPLLYVSKKLFTVCLRVCRQRRRRLGSTSSFASRQARDKFYVYKPKLDLHMNVEAASNDVTTRERLTSCSAAKRSSLFLASISVVDVAERVGGSDGIKVRRKEEKGRGSWRNKKAGTGRTPLAASGGAIRSGPQQSATTSTPQTATHRFLWRMSVCSPPQTRQRCIFCLADRVLCRQYWQPPSLCKKALSR